MPKQWRLVSDNSQKMTRWNALSHQLPMGSVNAQGAPLKLAIGHA
jgi:hypothetical protein